MIKFESVYIKRKDKEIFSDLDFSVQKNEKTLIKGKSGIGKTTLFKILLGFEPIDKGRVSFNGLDIVKEHIKDIRQQIFYLSQDIDLKNEKVKTLLDEIWKHNLLKILDNTRFPVLMNFLDLNEIILNQSVKELSGGERQRIGLFIGFLLDRPVWLLDEPTSSLDEKMKNKIMDYILGLEKTIIIISHDDVWEKNKTIKIERW
ncbi:MAG: ATP-binding cassette domain-containing protein [Desulfobacula sp.]|jgi:putative ABC transport system ATP-binding protein|uniref:ABC transporter ATP-binding protein n=1 Tax=Desulfobacula sp. TaxID=2593537 RepID=UPI001DF085BB|nr:ATP-binding cassette domain-containing protein [Desulfobacula sp.]MBT3483918.1 ATP-binding cassette domain-containing protein [Desulfobacula sp.]MBT3803895.1 ATP-binding cassette domain-containing protein [Desulfobacula sp.]MBT4023840.1 ATP-binding cassette domain-containing protein [Desulfobacula sp.]MBT4197600.1 ATP-binding cassette domain-containing protein [Desulfobacula sp.]